MYEESVKTPFVMRFPKGYEPKQKTISANVSQVDFTPTLMEYLGLDQPEAPAEDAPAGMSGVSLMPLVQGKKIKDRDIFIQFDGNGARGNFQRCVIRGNHKLIVDIFKDETFLELYDTCKDPQETVNLALNPDFETLTKDLISSLEQYMDRTGDMLVFDNDIYGNFIKNSGFFLGTAGNRPDSLARFGT
jgi:arylsulfatase A-like enzyme